jgi:dihydrofolate reductase
MFGDPCRIPRLGTVSRQSSPNKEADMARLRVHNFVISLDGYATGENQTIQTPFGHAHDEFMHWFEAMHSLRGLAPDGHFGVEEALAATWGPGVGAEIMGRNKFRPTSGPWPEDGWRGFWGEQPPFHTPCFVMTHYPRPPMRVGETTFHFVDGTPAEVLALATEAARGRDVRLGGGPTTVNEFLAADLVDYLHVAVVPIVLGGGVRLWDGLGGLGGLHKRFRVESVTVPSGATHVFFDRTV